MVNRTKGRRDSRLLPARNAEAGSAGGLSLPRPSPSFLPCPRPRLPPQAGHVWSAARPGPHGVSRPRGQPRARSKPRVCCALQRPPPPAPGLEQICGRGGARLRSALPCRRSRSRDSGFSVLELHGKNPSEPTRIFLSILKLLLITQRSAGPTVWVHDSQCNAAGSVGPPPTPPSAPPGRPHGSGSTAPEGPA